MTTFDYSSLPPGAKRVIIIGCGGLGISLATSLAAEGHRVRILDPVRSALDNLPRDPINEGLIMAMLADGTSENNLLKAAIRDADLFISATGSDSINALTAQMARHMFDIQSVICRIDEASKQLLYQSLGLVTVSGTGLAATAIIAASKDE